MPVTLVVLIVAVLAALTVWALSRLAAAARPGRPGDRGTLAGPLARRPPALREPRPGRSTGEVAGGLMLVVALGVVFATALVVGAVFDMVDREPRPRPVGPGGRRVGQPSTPPRGRPTCSTASPTSAPPATCCW